MARDAADGGGDGGVAEAAAAMTTARLRQAASHAPIPPLTTSECVSLANSIRPEKCDPRGQPAAPRSHGQATDLAKMNPPVKAADGSLLMTISSRSMPMVSGVMTSKASTTSTTQPVATSGMMEMLADGTTNRSHGRAAAAAAVVVAAGSAAAATPPRLEMPTGRLVPETLTTNRCRRVTAVGRAGGLNPRRGEKMADGLPSLAKPPRERAKNPQDPPAAGDDVGEATPPGPGQMSHANLELQCVANPPGPGPRMPGGDGVVRPALPPRAAVAATISRQFQADTTKTTRGLNFSASRKRCVMPRPALAPWKTTTYSPRADSSPYSMFPAGLKRSES